MVFFVLAWFRGENKRPLPITLFTYNRSLSFEKGIDYLCTMLEQDDPNSPEIKSVIRRMDNVTRYLLESLRNRGLLNHW